MKALQQIANILMQWLACKDHIYRVINRLYKGIKANLVCKDQKVKMKG